MAYSRNIRPKKRSGGLFIMIVGLALVGLHFYNTKFTATPREKLTVVAGRPVNPTITTIRGRFGATTNVLKFTVQGQTVEYDSTDTGYAGLLQAVQSGAILTLGVAPNEEALLSREGWVPFYTASSGSRQLVRYEAVIAHKKMGSFASLFIGGMVLLFGAQRYFG